MSFDSKVITNLLFFPFAYYTRDTATTTHFTILAAFLSSPFYRRKAGLSVTCSVIPGDHLDLILETHFQFDPI